MHHKERGQGHRKGGTCCLGAGGHGHPRAAEGLKQRQVGREGRAECQAASGLRHHGLSEGRHLRRQGHGFGAQETVRCRFGVIMGQMGDSAAGAVGAALGTVSSSVRGKEEWEQSPGKHWHFRVGEARSDGRDSGTFMHPCVCSLHRRVWSPCSVPGTVLSSGHSVVNKAPMIFALLERADQQKCFKNGE